MPADDQPRADAAALNRWSEALASIARTGLGFTENNFEAERYEEILAVAADMRVAVDRLLVGADAVDTATDTADAAGAEDPSGDLAALTATWLRSVGSGVPGYVTPKIAIGAVVGDDSGRILMIQRADSGVWLYPTGWADVGYSPAEVAIKEVQEETGIRCEVDRVLAVHDGLRAGFSRIPLYSLVFLCRAVGGELAPHPQECLDVGWFGRDDLPSPIASHERWVDFAFDAIEGHRSDVYYDEPRDPVWRGDPEHG